MMITKVWNCLEYHDSKRVLLRLRKVQKLVVQSNLPSEVANLRTRGLRKYLEGRQAALFCYGIGATVLGTDVYYALDESSDYDCVALWERNEEKVFAPVQLKELVPQTLNSKATLSRELSKLAKYCSSDNLVIALHVNRAGRLEFSDIQVPNLNVAQIWLYGATSPDQSKWFLYGNLLENAEYYEFKYPEI